MDPSQNKSDAEVEMLQQFEKVQFQNQSLKNQCERLQKLLDQITCSNDSQRTCSCGRKLRYVCTKVHGSKKEEEKKARKCDKCGQEGSRQGEVQVWWKCWSCQYCVCVKCEGYKKSVCPFSHFLQFKKFNPDIEQQQIQQQQRQNQQKQKEQKKQKQEMIQQIDYNLERKQSSTIHFCYICDKLINSNYYCCTCGFDMCKQCRDK